MFHKNKLKKIAIPLAILILLFIGFSFVAAQFTPEVEYPKIGTKEIGRTTELPDYIEYIFSLAIIIGVLIAVGSLIYGGFLYLSSTGAPEQMRAANSRILSALLGLVILLGSYLILNTVNPELLIIKIDKFEVQRGVKLIDYDTGKYKITEISIENLQKKYGDAFTPTKVKLLGTSRGELRAMAFSLTKFDPAGESTPWIENEENTGWAIQSIEVRGIGPGIYLRGEQEREVLFLSRDLEDFNRVDNFDNKVKGIEIKNFIVDEIKQTDFAAILYEHINFKGKSKLFVEKRDRNGDGERKDDEGNVPWDDPKTSDNTAKLPDITGRTGYGDVTGVSSAQIFQIGEESACKKIALYNQPNFKSVPGTTPCEFEFNSNPLQSQLPIYEPVWIEENCTEQWNGRGWNDGTMSIKIDGECLVVLFENAPPPRDTWLAPFPGTHNEVFMYNDPDLRDNHIGQCNPNIWDWGISGWLPCASAIAVFPIK